ncbi:hypothetical protein Tco_0864356 [Tanacetum coccineum]
MQTQITRGVRTLDAVHQEALNSLGDKLVSGSSKKQKSTAISNSSVLRQQKFNCSMLQQRSTLKSKVHRCTLPLYKGAGGEWNSGTVLYLDEISTG